ncbi:hypothetical protein HDU98_006333 [Podochytrium sp. JEL0797]|nr:hypothetical protein HDU98_006333 [Podochytrium sp. JEL0797]
MCSKSGPVAAVAKETDAGSESGESDSGSESDVSNEEQELEGLHEGPKLSCLVKGCYRFGRSFKTKLDLSKHAGNYHCHQTTILIPGRSGPTVVVRSEDGALKCPMCGVSITASANFRHHATKSCPKISEAPLPDTEKDDADSEREGSLGSEDEQGNDGDGTSGITCQVPGCPKAGMVLQGYNNMHAHKHNYHCAQINVPELPEPILRGENGCFACPLCSRPLRTANAARLHIRSCRATGHIPTPTMSSATSPEPKTKKPLPQAKATVRTGSWSAFSSTEKLKWTDLAIASNLISSIKRSPRYRAAKKLASRFQTMYELYETDVSDGLFFIPMELQDEFLEFLNDSLGEEDENAVELGKRSVDDIDECVVGDAHVESDGEESVRVGSLAKKSRRMSVDSDDEKSGVVVEKAGDVGKSVGLFLEEARVRLDSFVKSGAESTPPTEPLAVESESASVDVSDESLPSTNKSVAAPPLNPPSLVSLEAKSMHPLTLPTIQASKLSEYESDDFLDYEISESPPLRPIPPPVSVDAIQASKLDESEPMDLGTPASSCDPTAPFDTPAIDAVAYTDILHEMVPDYGNAPGHVKDGILDGAKLFLRACFEDEGSEGNLADYIVGGSVLIPREIVGDFASWVFPQLQELLPGMDVREWVEGE